MKKSEFWRSAMHAASIPKDGIELALEVIQKPMPYPDDATDIARVSVELIESWWRVYAWWIAYEQNLDDGICICKKPYNTPPYQSARSIARVHSAMLKLCEQLCITVPQPILTLFSPNQQPYQYALGFWVSCMLELKKREIDALFQDTGVDEDNINKSKDFRLKRLRTTLKILRDERSVPNSWFKGYPINSTILKSCIELAWGNSGEIDWSKATIPESQSFRNQCWNVYLEIYNHHIQDIKRQAAWRDCFEKDGKFFCYERGKPKVLGFNSWHHKVQEWYRNNVE